MSRQSILFRTFKNFETRVYNKHSITWKTPSASFVSVPPGSATKKTQGTNRKPGSISKNINAIGDKIFRFSTWTGSLALISCGTLVAAIIFANLYTELSSDDTPSQYFQISFEELQKNSRVIKAFGSNMTAHADPRSKRRRPHLPGYQLSWDSRNCQHLMMVYYLEGDSDRDIQGIVSLHMVDTQPRNWSSQKEHQPNWQYKLLAVDLPGSGLSARRIVVRGDETRIGGIW